MSNADKIADLVSAFGVDVKAKLAGPGQAEANLRKPLENLLVEAAAVLGKKATFFDEVSDDVRGVRPDYAFQVDGAITGYVEVKSPGHTLDPSSLHGHDLEQWERQQDLPNLLYTNGTEFRLYRDGELLLDPVTLKGGNLEKVGSNLQVSNEFELLLNHLFKWKPAAITSLSRLIAAVAPLTRLLREAVLEQIAIESKPGKSEAEQPFSGLARDWRTLLFPEATDSEFADGYAQTVAFALLLARVEDIDLDNVSLHEVGNLLGNRHSLMGRALQLLTDQIVGDFKVSLDLLVRVIGAVNWDKIQEGAKDEYPYLYEKFLEVYDPELRKESGSYYTPVQAVDQMTRLAEDALKTRLNKANGFADEQVFTVDPAMGTGTYLQSIIERTSNWAKETKGPEGHKAELRSLAERLVGFEIQTGPFAVAEMRLTELLKSDSDDAAMPPLRLYVADTLDDPHAPEQVFPSNYLPISASRKAAAKVKREENVMVVIGNPPYGEQAEGEGGWIESGSAGGSNDAVPLDSFRSPGNGRREYVLKNLYIYFWRWATWKAFDSIPDDKTGVVCLITTSGYIRGPGFKGMRNYLRKTCSEGWIINVSPEGLQPPVNTRIFPGVQQTLAIAIFVRSGNSSNAEPAQIRYREIDGKRDEKYEALAEIGLDDDGWRIARTDWESPFTPAADSDWDEFPAINDLMPWAINGVKANRTWVYSPSSDLLASRWDLLVSETDEDEKSKLFKESGDSSLARNKQPLPGSPSNHFEGPFEDESGPLPELARTFYRAFDRQLIIPDSRILDRPRPDLWAARVPGQMFVIEQHSKILADGPGLLFSNLIPDQDAFVAPGGGGSRCMPLLHPDETANLAPGLVEALGKHFDLDVEPLDVLGYIAAVVGQPAFVEHFLDELNTPGIRVPISGDPDLFKRAVQIGRRVLWLASFAEADFLDPDDVTFEYPVGNPNRPQILTDSSSLPSDDEVYDPETKELKIGGAVYGPVSEAVANYQVGGRKVIHSWVGYRKAIRSGRKSSPLDHLAPESWPKEWTDELLQVITVLSRLVEIHQEQANLLNEILGGEILTKQDLLAEGVHWPNSNDDRDPRYPAPDGEELFGILE